MVLCDDKTRMDTTNKTTLNSPIIVGHNLFIESTLILIMKFHMGYIEFQPTLKYLVKKLAWVMNFSSSMN